MADKRTHIAGPVYIAHGASALHWDDASIPEDAEALASWFAEVSSGLRALAPQLDSIIKNTSEYRTDVHFALGEQFLDDALFVRVPLSQPGLDVDAVRVFLDAVIAAAKNHGTIWATDESNLGQTMASVLALGSLEDVPRFIRFMESCDLDHEVDHGGEFCEVPMAHGWTPETVALWVARCGTCAGQHGHESEWETPDGQTIGDWISEDKARESLLVRLIAANLIALQDWRHADDVPYLHSAMEGDGMGIFFEPETLAGLGLGAHADSIANSALALAKERVTDLASQGQSPGDWLDELER